MPKYWCTHSQEDGRVRYEDGDKDKLTFTYKEFFSIKGTHVLIYIKMFSKTSIEDVLKDKSPKFNSLIIFQ